MKRQKETKKIGGIEFEVETITTTPEDGFVPQRKIRPTDMNSYGKFHKGYTTTKRYSTSDPRITRPFVYSVCGIFFIIGLVMLLFKNWFFGIISSATAVFCFIKSKKDIDAIAEEMKLQGKDVTIDSIDEAKLIKSEFTKEVNSGFKEVAANTFTKERYKKFCKMTIPVYSFVAIAVSLLIIFLVNIYLGIFVFAIMTIVGLIYYWILKKIFKY